MAAIKSYTLDIEIYLTDTMACPSIIYNSVLNDGLFILQSELYDSSLVQFKQSSCLIFHTTS